MKPGDTVRYLNATGGGIITRIDGNMAYVEEDGFETPVLMKELVVVLPAGHKQADGARLMFDQKAFDKGRDPMRGRKPSLPEPEESLPTPEPDAAPAEETPHGDIMNLSLAFEPTDVSHLSASRFAAVLVNDSNYFLNFAFSTRGDADKGWNLVFQGSVAPNELIDLADYSPSDLPGIERVALQAVAYKKDKPFTLQDPVAVSRRIDTTKFHKFHCFRPGLYFDSPVLEFPLVSEGHTAGSLTEKHLHDLEQSLDSRSARESLAAKEGPTRKNTQVQKPSPFKLLEPVEVDLHINALTDTTAGMRPADMLELQLETVRRTMKEHRRRIGQKIIFIHGKGEGVLRQNVIKLLKKEYPKTELQDASFREYGFGATLVTIH